MTNLCAVDIAKPARQTFISLLEAYQKDPHFCIPYDARRVFEKHGKETRYIVLGTKDFGAAFLSAIAGKGQALYVVDDFKCHRGEQFGGADIISTDRFLTLAKSDPSIIAINACRYDYSKRFFDGLCRTHHIPCLNHEQAARLIGLNDTLDYRLADWGEVIAARSAEYLALEERMADAYSRESLLRVLSFHLSAEPEWYLNIARPYCTLYFRSGLLNFGKNEKFVDCGASIGESTSALLGTTKGELGHAWMIEPDRINVGTLQKMIRAQKGTPLEGKISLHPYAVGETQGEAPFHHIGGHGGTIITTGNAATEKVEVRPVDAIIDDVPTFIKMDIEGYELPALKGCTRSIQAGHPKLAISAYHRPTDLIDLPAFVDSIAPGYQIGLRHHTEDRWDTCLYFYRSDKPAG